MKKSNLTQFYSILFLIVFYAIGSNAGTGINQPTSSSEKIAFAEDKELAELQSIAEEAYTYAFPMLIGYKVLYDFNINENSGQYKAPINVLSSEARVFTPNDTIAAGVNSDTPYSFAQLDLRTEPMVLYMPEIDEERYYDVQLTDMYTHNFGYMGSRTTGNKAGYYMIAGPGWDGKLPKGIKKVFRCETQITMVIYRTQLFGPDDMPNVAKIQAGYKIQPLSSYLKKAAPQAAPPIDWIPFKQEGFTTHFTQYLNFMLQFCPPTGGAAVEVEMRERFKKLGIGPGLPFNPKMFTHEQIAAIGAGIKNGYKKINHRAENVGKIVNGWQIVSSMGNRDFFNGDYVLRAAGAKNGIYGNNPEEATYPFAKVDVNGKPIDASQHNYTITFPAGQLPPVNAFWSVTMYNRKMFLVNNPIDRYLINSPMLEGLKKNADGSITIFVQHKSPGKDKESNWLPAPNGPANIVMRLYWPKAENPSVLPPGEGTWAPPTVMPVTNLKAEKVNRVGDKSFENVVRTDERYGNDPMFFGPRGFGYWNYLENPKPIQNPNLWPDQHSTYFLAKLKLPPGSELTLNGVYPRVRYMKVALYKEKGGTFISIGQDLAGFEVKPDAGSVNPFVPGNKRLSDKRNFTITLKAIDPPSDVAKREVNTLYTGADGGTLEMVLRIYLPDQGMDGAGWGSSSSAEVFGDLPVYTGKLADGTTLSSAEVVEHYSLGFESNTKQPLSAQQWVDIVNNKDNNPDIDPETIPATKIPKWEKYWTLPYSILGAFKTPEERAKIPYAGAMDGGGDPATQYMLTWINRKFGPVYVMRGKMPTFPNTFEGERGLGLEVMPDAQTQYWSIVSGEAAPSGKIVDGLADMQIPLDKNGKYTIVVSRKEDRPVNATLENGIAWLEWAPKGEGLVHPKNRADFGILMLRIMANNPTWKERPDNIVTPGTEEEIMGPYFPVGEYTDKASFEAQGKLK